MIKKDVAGKLLVLHFLKILNKRQLKIREDEFIFVFKGWIINDIALSQT